MKFIKKHLFTLIAVVTTLMATSVATSACLWSSYQPEEPKCLREK
ncbi:cyclic lactone autoinducer peptide [Clostridium estertheticum]|nr:cyclic lactone autoinducer peptide [Clostridium estertheticum]MBW9151523.1 cyclic lactone autoinducer peptide [Clostridium estertheticum]WLC83345.1 cyclic lactone autoinducer peptide [Clostridium estertheticum]